MKASAKNLQRNCVGSPWLAESCLSSTALTCLVCPVSFPHPCCCGRSIGVALPYALQGERHRNTIFLFRAFAAGVVLSVAFVHILPGERPKLRNLASVDHRGLVISEWAIRRTPEAWV